MRTYLNTAGQAKTNDGLVEYFTVWDDSHMYQKATCSL